jgi:hypothetical protein
VEVRRPAFDRRFHVGVERSRPARQVGRQAQVDDGSDRVDLVRPHRRGADLDLAHAGAGQERCDLRLLCAGERDAGGLLSVPQRRVGDEYRPFHA